MARADRQAIIKKIEAKRNSRLVCYLTSDRPNADGPLAKDAIPILTEQLRAIGDVPQIDILLYTGGGDTLAAFGISRLLREYCKKTGVLIPFRCHSAGTLVALGADEVVMTRSATLTPIDPSLVGPLGPAIEVAPGQRQMVPLSVESVRGYEGLVTKDWDMKDQEVRAAAFKALVDRVHPLALGDVYRARQQIERLARTLLQEHRKDEENIAKIIRTLTQELGSHDYPVSRNEARKLLGSQLAPADDVLESLIWDLYRDFAAEMELGTQFDPMLAVLSARGSGIQGPVQVVQKLAMLESSDSNDICERVFQMQELSPQNVPPQFLPQLLAAGGQAIQQRIVRAGWRHYA